MKNETWVVAVTAGRWQKHGIQTLKDLGFKVIGVDGDANAEAFGIVDVPLAIDISKHQEIIEKIEKLNHKISGVICFCSEVGMELAAVLREHFKVPGPGLLETKRLVDKSVQREVWTKKNVPGPKWKMFLDEKAAVENAGIFGFPVIIKPIDSSGSRGVHLIESATDNVSLHIENAFKASKSKRVLLESYMKGTEFTVETFVHNFEVHVLAMSEKKKVAGTGGTVAYELATPNRPKEVLEKISSTVRKAFEALDYKMGAGHAEIILMEDGSVGMVEAAGRGGGFLVFDQFIPAVSSVNIAKLCSEQCVGINPEIGKPTQNSAVLRFFPSKKGTVQAISGFEKAQKLSGVLCSPFVKIGDKVGQAQADGDRLGYILSKAKTHAEAFQLADAAEEMIHFEIH